MRQSIAFKGIFSGFNGDFDVFFVTTQSFGNVQFV